MTLSEIAYNILNTASGGKSSNDINISFRQVIHWINYYRAALIKANNQISGTIHPQCFQHVNFRYVNNYDLDTNNAYDAMSQAGSHNIAINTEVDQLSGNAQRTYYEFLEPYGRQYGNDLTYGDVTYKIKQLIHLDRDYAVRDCKVRINDTYFQADWVPVPIVSMDEWEMGKFNRFTSKNPKAVIYRVNNPVNTGDNLITFHNLKTILKNSGNTNADQIIDYYVHFRGIFAEPEKIEGYDIDNDDYPCPPEYIESLVENILKKEMSVTLKSSSDLFADETDTYKAYGAQNQQKVQR
jgi:hypothetical protein